MSNPGAADEGMVRSEEQVLFTTVNVPVGRARLVTYVVTEDQTFTIPVSRQEVRLEYDPLPASEQIATGTPHTEETYEVVRHIEQVLFTKQVVPVERVRMIKRTVATAQTVTKPLRSEQVTLTRRAPDGVITGTDDGDITTPVPEHDQPRTGNSSWD